MVAHSDILVGSSSGFSLKYQFENLPNLLHKFSFKIYSLKIRREKIEVDLLGLIRSILKGQIRSFETWISNTGSDADQFHFDTDSDLFRRKTDPAPDPT